MPSENAQRFRLYGSPCTFAQSGGRHRRTWNTRVIPCGTSSVAAPTRSRTRGSTSEIPANSHGTLGRKRSLRPTECRCIRQVHYRRAPLSVSRELIEPSGTDSAHLALLRFDSPSHLESPRHWQSSRAGGESENMWAPESSTRGISDGGARGGRRRFTSVRFKNRLQIGRIKSTLHPVLNLLQVCRENALTK
jgi:hypothetical protein